MNKYLLILCLMILRTSAESQCLTNSLVINTGYNPLTGTAIAGGSNGGTPVIDPYWYLTAVSPGVATAISLTGIPGLIEVIPGNNANVIQRVGTWAVNPGPDPGGWISCLNSNTYNTPGLGTTAYNMTLGRQFRMCTDDSITLTLYIANDNWCSSSNIDGVPLGFSQAVGELTTTYSTYEFFTQTVYLTAGTHTINFVVNNYDQVGTSGSNPTGLDIYGTVASTSGLNSLVSESVTGCNTYVCGTTCNTVAMPDSLHLCIGATGSFNAVTIGPDTGFSFLWTPATGLSSTTVLDPVVTAITSGWYNLTAVFITPDNLVGNGDFSGGNSGFSTGYTLEGFGTTSTPGDYAVETNPNLYDAAWPAIGDHTTGTGNMLMVDGSPTAGISFWCENMPVLPNTNYSFKVWTALLAAPTPTIQLTINGVNISTFTTSATSGLWQEYQITWNSGTATTAAICMSDLNTAGAGNDFAVDDISFNQECIAVGSEYLAVQSLDTTYAHSDTAFCTNTPSLTLTANTGYLSYLWSTGSTGGSIVVTASGSYWVYDSSATCSMLIDTFNVNFKPFPVVTLGNDTGFCQGDSIVLTSIEPAGDTLLWSTGSIGDTIHVSTSGIYSLTVSNGCTSSASISVTVSPTPLVNLGPDTTECSGSPIVLQSSDSYSSGVTYLWSNTTTAATTTATASGTYWLQVTMAGCSAADTIHVSILYDTFTLYNRDTAICKGQSVQVLASGNTAAQTYLWEPSAGIASYTSITPLITPDTSATYAVFVLYPGCPGFVDSFHIDVQPTPIVYIGGNRSVCDHDTLHINASVTPQWYPGYIYSWSPAGVLDNTNTSSVVFTAGDTSELILKVTTSAGCTGVDSAQIIVHTDSFVHYDTSFTICPGDSVKFQPVSDDPATAYVWHPAMYMSDTSSSTPWVFPLTTQLYYAVATSQYGCRDTVSANVAVLPEAVLYIGDSVTIYPGQSYQMNPQTNCSTFLWFPPSGLSNAYISDPVAMPEISTKYLVYGTTSWGCKAEDSINIFVDGNILLAVPNAFAPGNGPDNIFKIIVNGAATLNYFHIYNRWGNLVYSSADINAGWDGTFNGVPQPFDVYVYEIEAVTAAGKTFHKTGNVTLVR